MNFFGTIQLELMHITICYTIHLKGKLKAKPKRFGKNDDIFELKKERVNDKMNMNDLSGQYIQPMCR